MINDKKGFTLFETLVCVGIIAVIAAIAVPVTQGFIEKARILDANTKAKTISNIINAYLINQEISDKGMVNNGKYMYIAIAAGSEPLVSDARITARNDFVKDDAEIISSSWKTPYMEHLLNIIKEINDNFSGNLNSCFIIAVISNNSVVQVYYVPNIDKADLNPDYNETVLFFSKHCEIKGKTDNMNNEPYSDKCTVFIKKDGTVSEGRSATGMYKGMIIGTSPVI